MKGNEEPLNQRSELFNQIFGEDEPPEWYYELTEMFRLHQPSLQGMDAISEAVIVLGSTKVGKTTLLNVLLGCDPKKPNINELTFDKVIHFDNPIITPEQGTTGGDVLESETVCNRGFCIPEGVYEEPEMEIITLVDSPGFFESRGRVHRIVADTSNSITANSVSTPRAVLLVIKFQDIINDGDGVSMVKELFPLAESILQFFDGDTIHRSIGFIINRMDPQYSKVPMDQLVQTLLNSVSSAKQRLQEAVDKLASSNLVEKLSGKVKQMGHNLVSTLLGSSTEELSEEESEMLKKIKRYETVIRLFDLMTYRNVIPFFDLYNLDPEVLKMCRSRFKDVVLSKNSQNASQFRYLGRFEERANLCEWIEANTKGSVALFNQRQECLVQIEKLETTIANNQQLLSNLDTGKHDLSFITVAETGGDDDIAQKEESWRDSLAKNDDAVLFIRSNTEPWTMYVNEAQVSSTTLDENCQHYLDILERNESVHHRLILAALQTEENENVLLGQARTLLTTSIGNDTPIDVTIIDMSIENAEDNVDQWKSADGNDESLALLFMKRENNWKLAVRHSEVLPAVSITNQAFISVLEFDDSILKAQLANLLVREPIASSTTRLNNEISKINDELTKTRKSYEKTKKLLKDTKKVWNSDPPSFSGAKMIKQITVEVMAGTKWDWLFRWEERAKRLTYDQPTIVPPETSLVKCLVGTKTFDGVKKTYARIPKWTVQESEKAAKEFIDKQHRNQIFCVIIGDAGYLGAKVEHANEKTNCLKKVYVKTGYHTARCHQVSNGNYKSVNSKWASQTIPTIFEEVINGTKTREEAALRMWKVLRLIALAEMEIFGQLPVDEDTTKHGEFTKVMISRTKDHAKTYVEKNNNFTTLEMVANTNTTVPDDHLVDLLHGDAKLTLYNNMNCGNVSLTAKFFIKTSDDLDSRRQIVAHQLESAEAELDVRKLVIDLEGLENFIKEREEFLHVLKSDNKTVLQRLQKLQEMKSSVISMEQREPKLKAIQTAKEGLLQEKRNLNRLNRLITSLTNDIELVHFIASRVDHGVRKGEIADSWHSSSHLFEQYRQEKIVREQTIIKQSTKQHVFELGHGYAEAILDGLDSPNTNDVIPVALMSPEQIDSKISDLEKQLKALKWKKRQYYLEQAGVLDLQVDTTEAGDVKPMSLLQKQIQRFSSFDIDYVYREVAEQDHDNNSLFHLVINRDDNQLLHRLLEEGSMSCTLPNKNGDTPIISAAIRGNLDAVRLLVGSGAPMLSKDARGQTIMHIAAGSIHGTRILHEYSQFQELRVNVDQQGKLPIHHALENHVPQNFSILAKLMVSEKDKVSQSRMLEVMVKANANECLLELLKHENFDPLLRARDEDSNQNILHMCASHGRTDLMSNLLTKPDLWNSLINQKTKENHTPLMIAAMGDKFSCTRLLSKNGADLECTAQQKRAEEMATMGSRTRGVLENARLQRDNNEVQDVTTEVDWKSWYADLMAHDPSVVSDFLTGKQDLQPDVDGNTIVHHAIQVGVSTDMMEVLQAHEDIHLSKGNNNNETPLHLAVASCSLDLVKFLLEHLNVKDLMDVDQHSRTALHFAAMLDEESGDALQVLKKLLENDTLKAVIDVRDKYGDNIADLCVSHMNKEMLASVLNVNSECVSMQTINHLCTQDLDLYLQGKTVGMLECILKTIDQSQGGEMLNCIASNGMTLLHRAVKHNMNKVVKFLVCVDGVNPNGTVRQFLNRTEPESSSSSEKMEAVVSGNRETALHFAVAHSLETGDTSVLDELLKHPQISTEVQNAEGKTALDLIIDANCTTDDLVTKIASSITQRRLVADQQVFLDCFRRTARAVNDKTIDKEIKKWILGSDILKEFLLQSYSDCVPLDTLRKTLKQCAINMYQSDPNIIKKPRGLLKKQKKKDFDDKFASAFQQHMLDVQTPFIQHRISSTKHSAFVMAFTQAMEDVYCISMHLHDGDVVMAQSRVQTAVSWIAESKVLIKFFTDQLINPILTAFNTAEVDEGQVSGFVKAMDMAMKFYGAYQDKKEKDRIGSFLDAVHAEKSRCEELPEDHEEHAYEMLNVIQLLACKVERMFADQIALLGSKTSQRTLAHLAVVRVVNFLKDNKEMHENGSSGAYNSFEYRCLKAIFTDDSQVENTPLNPANDSYKDLVTQWEAHMIFDGCGFKVQQAGGNFVLHDRVRSKHAKTTTPIYGFALLDKGFLKKMEGSGTIAFTNVSNNQTDPFSDAEVTVLEGDQVFEAKRGAMKSLFESCGYHLGKAADWIAGFWRTEVTETKGKGKQTAE